ncbi:hypothetical protein Salat_1093400 [Sesamum alatum]|uniref:Uncharacterized protein n=1 Tax=Sesamum alatum TaxID=300844 RepID=A0AAE2CSV1_9LAMI|nr:hypothetical protein Salat_1093400 [Sesamum alatum]
MEKSGAAKDSVARVESSAQRFADEGESGTEVRDGGREQEPHNWILRAVEQLEGRDIDRVATRLYEEFTKCHSTTPTWEMHSGESLAMRNPGSLRGQMRMRFVHAVIGCSAILS